MLAERLEPRLEIPPLAARARFGAFAYREFRLLWSGLLLSNTGSWMQMLAQGWLVVELAGSPALGPFYLGLVGFVRAVPVLLLSGFAGALADRTDRRRILAAAQSAMALSALVLGVLTATGVIRIWQVLLLAAISSAAAAFDAPTRQSLVSHLVGPGELMNAIGLNSAAFNGPAVIGPALGGLAVSTIGIAACFFINAASYGSVLLALAFIAPKPPLVTDRQASIWHEVVEGIRYVRRNRAILTIIGLAVLVALLCRPYIQLLPAVAKAVVHTGPHGLGILMAASGAGALGGSIITALIGLRRGRGLLLPASAGAAGIVMVIFAGMRTLWPTSIVLIVLGSAIMLFMGITNTLLQIYTPLEMRGRVMSIYTMTFLGIMPLGAWVLGSAAALTSLPFAFAASGAIVIVAALIALTRRELRDLA